MNKSTKPFPLLLLAFLFVIPAVSRAQSPYPSLSFVRERNDAGSTDYVLRPVIDEIHKKVGGYDKPYQILGAVARPTSHAAVLMFANAQKEFQFQPKTDDSVVIKADTYEIGNLKYELSSQSKSDVLVKLEIANVLITLNDFNKIAKARSVVVKYGRVVYELDRDNLNALKYMAEEIEKDQHKTP